ncbi:hypothetical protein [Anaerocolumna sp. MB42-C2]|uniref:hypothetical protein n=1 Tax=Anaerocolumna sp. MB42-C2 TaxID=3070997 RepID=UPI0027DF9076|nr:hypothetical protein [Anaerocolumna sp. MB42-C2]WMJ89043.1 hypothetical protein RBU59_05845 [Anaerocolumna sp. MB42-C2]
MDNDFQNGGLEKPMSLGDWVITLIVLAIPCVGLIMMFVWGFGQGNTNRRNYCRATLIFAAIGIVLGLVFYASIAAALTSAFSSLAIIL